MQGRKSFINSILDDCRLSINIVIYCNENDGNLRFVFDTIIPEYHFRRVFSYLAGMSLSEYIRLRKLTYAAILLKDNDKKIIDIAMCLGYESPDAFTKAFQSVHNVTPTQARKGSVGLKAFPPMTFQIKIQGGNVMDYRIEPKDGFKIVGISKRITLVYEGVNTQMDSMWLSCCLIDLRKPDIQLKPIGVLAA